MITNKSIGYNGQLCNQIIQHAALICLGAKKGYTVKLPAKNETVKPDGAFDYTSNTWVPYKLDLYNCFDLKSEKCSDKEMDELKYNYNQVFFGFEPKFFEIEDFTNVGGYFQSEKYFADAKKEILKEFTFKPYIEKKSKDIINQINNREIVSIHIRRGTYMINPTSPVLDLKYFSKALEYFTDKDYNFLILSDDINWCKDTFKKENNVFFSENNSNYVDLCVMSKCDHNIISNSTFSWWAAWSNMNPNKKVIAPSVWFQPNVTNYTKDIYCKDWIVI
jgi:hypothetical protein